MIIVSQILVSIIHAASLAFLWRSRRRNPVFLFAVFNWFFSFGTISNLDPKISADQAHFYLVVFSSIGVLAYSVMLFNHRRYATTEGIFASRIKERTPNTDTLTTWLLLAVSILVSFFYFEFLVGYNLFLPALIGADLDFTALRLASYAGDSYTGAGVVNQFKNTILPISFFCLIATYASARRWTVLLISLLVLAPIFLWCIMGTGQRTFIFFSVAGAIYSFSVHNKKVPPLALIAMIAAFVFVFGAFSVALERTSDRSFLGVLSEVSHRLLSANQTGAVYGFRYVYEREITYGAEWLQALIGLIPGVSGSALSSEVFNSVFGGYRGTIPVSLWTSVYHNYGMIGVIPAAILIMKIIESSHFLLRFIPMTHLHLTAYSFMCFYFAIMPMTPPVQILNNGLIGIILVFLIASLRIRKSKMSLRFARHV